MSTIYGVDTKKPYNAIDVRDALVSCFTQAHEKVLEKSFGKEKEDFSEKEFEKIKKLNIKQMIETFFEQTGGDFEHPDREQILKVMDKCAEFASNFRDQKTISKNYNLIKTLVDGLK